jgi:HPt (histidine-containing phosphotransfer) domain-containing protein
MSENGKMTVKKSFETILPFLKFTGRKDWFDFLQKVAEELNRINASTEKEFLDLGERLHDFYQRTSLLKRVLQDKNLGQKILGGFLKDMPEQFVFLEQAIDGKNDGEVQRLGHTIKGAAANVEAGSMKTGALKLEEAWDKGDLVGLSLNSFQKEEDMKTLVVEDDYTSRLSMETFLQAYGEATVP